MTCYTEIALFVIILIIIIFFVYCYNLQGSRDRFDNNTNINKENNIGSYVNESDCLNKFRECDMQCVNIPAGSPDDYKTKCSGKCFKNFSHCFGLNLNNCDMGWFNCSYNCQGNLRNTNCIAECDEEYDTCPVDAYSPFYYHNS